MNTKCVGDITDLPIDDGKSCYLATVIDLASRRLAWAIADHMRADLAIDAPAAAIRLAAVSPDRSITPTTEPKLYTSRSFAELCRSAGVR